MRSVFALLILGLAGAGSALAQGRLVPTQADVPPLNLTRQKVKVAIEDQVAVTHVEQTFRNPTSRDLEATYFFPVPKGASVKKFVMWVGGKEVPGELVEAEKARAIYTDIVRRAQDPGLLEYMGSNLLKVRVYPVPAHGEQKLAVNYTSIATSDSGMVEYVYPLRAENNAFRSVEKFTLEVTLKSQQPIQNIYSPTHAIAIRRPNDRGAVVHFEGTQASLDKDFQLYYTATGKDVGLTALTHRAAADKDGHFMLLISPRAELSKTQQVPRDMVFVLDTSGSMSGARIEQARNALKFCLRNLGPKDRFGLIHFATTVTKYQEQLRDATQSEIAQAQKWVDNLEATGSTNIDEALTTALAMRPAQEKNRNFTIVFFTDGQPTIGECDPTKLVKNVAASNTANTRIFTFGVGDDVNAVLLDQLAEKTRSVSTFVRESEDIEAKVSNFYAKISHPVMTNLKLTFKQKGDQQVSTDSGDWMDVFYSNVKWKDIYPQQLPDLFHGSQLVVLGRYSGHGKTTVTLSGMVGNEKKEFTYDVAFPSKTGNDKVFVEDLWARRKVGYLLDQIRVNGEHKEVKDEVISLAKKYGITTPYTSYLVVPDVAPRAVARAQNFTFGSDMSLRDQWRKASPAPQTAPPMPAPGYLTPPPGPVTVTSIDRGALPYSTTYGSSSSQPAAPAPAGTAATGSSVPTYGDFGAYYAQTVAPTTTSAPTAQSGKEGVDLAEQLNALRNQEQVSSTAVRQVLGRKCLNVNGVWFDEGVLNGNAKLPMVKIKAQSAAYFRMLERHAEVKEVFQLGNRTLWITPNQTVLVIDAAAGDERMSDADIDRLFVVKK